MKLRELLDKWIDGELRVGNLSNGTVDSYIRIAGRIGKSYIGGLSADSISADDMQTYVDLLSLGGEAPDGSSFPGYSKDYVHMFTAVLNHSMRYAVHPLHLRTDNPMQFVILHKKRSYPDLFAGQDTLYQDGILLEHEKFHELISYLKSHKRNSAVLPIQISYYTGLRIGETCALDWNDLCLSERYFVVRRSITRNTERKCVEIGPTKGGKPRIVDFGETLYDILKAWKIIQDKNSSELSTLYRHNFVRKDVIQGRVYYSLFSTAEFDDTSVYSTEDSTELHLICTKKNGSFILPEAVSDACRKASSEIDGLDGFHFHSLRHTYTSNLISGGASPKDVQELLGHSDVRTTMNVYAHAHRESKKASVKLLDGL